MDDPQRPTGTAEQAFDALREEVTRLRQGIELIYRLVQQIGAADGPDHSQTLAELKKMLQGMDERMKAIERGPLLTLTPARLAREVEPIVHRAVAAAPAPALATAASSVQQSAVVLQGLIGRVRERREQRAWMLVAGFNGLLAGVLLWLMLIRFLPWGAGDWLASLPLGGDRWQAGQLLLQRARPDDFERIMLLDLACGDLETRRCEKAMTALATPAQPPAVSVPTISLPKRIHGGQ
jgi:hypothetical protein